MKARLLLTSDLLCFILQPRTSYSSDVCSSNVCTKYSPSISLEKPQWLNQTNYSLQPFASNSGGALSHDSLDKS